MIQGIGVQTKNVIDDKNPVVGFKLLREAGFTCCDFSLNSYFYNKDVYEAAQKGKLQNDFFSKSIEELIAYFRPMKDAAKEVGICINQMHMPYPIYIPGGDKVVNDYLWNEVAVKSMQIAGFLECPNIVIHGFKLSQIVGSEEREWAETEKFIEYLAPYAIENHTTICIENLYNGAGSHMLEGPCCDAKKAAARIDEMNAKYGHEVLGFCFDVGHANLVSLDFEKFLVTLGKRLKVLHIHDNDGAMDLHQIPYTFTKTRDNKPSTDWDGFITGLKAIDFDGVLSFETAPVLNAFPEELKGDALRMIAKIGYYFKHEIE